MRVIDLFSGAGGMSLGFRMAGFEPVGAVEIEGDFAATYRANFGDHIHVGDVAQFEPSESVDVIIGGPPCQGFSSLTGNDPDDPRRALWSVYVDVVEKMRPRAFVIENVPNILNSDEGRAIHERARSLGYAVTSGVLLASDFRVPQNRRRAFIIGSLSGPISLPDPAGKPVSVREAFTGIPADPLHMEFPTQPVSGSGLHVGRRPTDVSLRRYAVIPPGGNRYDLIRLAPEIAPACWLKATKGGTDIFGRIHWDEPARCTIRCEFYKPEKGRFLHPAEDRPITHWEASRLQSFPDDFLWCGTKARVARQIGNAVPPLLAAAVANKVREHLDG